MEARLRIWGLNKEAVLIVATLLLLVAAMAAGYGIRAATGSSNTPHTAYVASGGTTSAAQSDAPCVWLGTSKGC